MGNNNNTKNSKINKLEDIKQEGNFDDIKSKYILRKIFDYLNKKKSLEITNLNKKLQNRLEININDYIENCETNTTIEIEIIPKKNKYGKFINIINKEEESYFHIYFNNDINETKKYDIKKGDKVKRIKLIIDYQVKSFCKLFFECECIESISFTKFHRNNIIDMNCMFNSCISLKDINFLNFNTENVINMSYMFNSCSSLNRLDLSKFNTEKVTDMSYMFSGCSTLKELKINFNTKNVKNMSYMFDGCSTINYIPTYNFNTSNVENMSYMFYGCKSLKDIILSNFNTKKVNKMNCMFLQCSDDLISKIEALYDNIWMEAFEEDEKDIVWTCGGWMV